MAVNQQQQELNMSKFMAAQSKARQLIAQDARQEIQEGRVPKNIPTLSQTINGFNGSPSSMPLNEDYDMEEQEMPSFDETAFRDKFHVGGTQRPLMTEGQVRNSKLPKEILQSMKSNPIDTTLMEQQQSMQGTSSVLDVMGIKPQPKPKARVQEQASIPTASATVDYALIKTIVEDCMKKSLSAMKKSLLNENKQGSDDNLAVIKIGESFKFVTSNGDLYEAKLVKKGNVHDKK